ncbi:MAG: asparagine synthase (glutamine-hydrolyzing) [Solirubrobacteraceae bacterium]
MCGIAGVAGGAPDRRSALRQAMSDALRHRGPDEAGAYEDECVALAIRRLAVIDVAHGHQPYTNEDGTVHVVFNGEIYGFMDLRDRLERLGHRFASGADGEVIAHAYEEFGADFVAQLDGMFAIALWDSVQRRLFLARDRLGKKPLYVWHRPDGSLSFASELAALMLDDRLHRQLDPVALSEYLQYGYVPSPRSILQGVEKLEPGTSLTWTADGKVSRSRYWSLDFEPKLTLSYAEALDEFEARAQAAVRARLISDVPLGLFLSGGVDSSYVLAQMIAAGASDVQTFAIGFADVAYNESEHARRIAQHLGSVHHEAIVEPDDLVELLPSLVAHYGEPFADGSAIPTFYVARWARREITVALTGEGGDELFGGYYRHQAARVAAGADRLPAVTRKVAGLGARRVGSELAHPMSTRHKLYRFLRAIELEPGERYAEWTAVLTPDERSGLSGNPARAPRYQPPGRATDPLDRALAVDLTRSLPDQLLFKMDIATMASSLEARAPLLDYRLVEWAARLPTSYKQRGRTRKRLLVDALARHVPPELFRRPKMGFTAPISVWLRRELYELTTDTLLSEASRQRGIVDSASVERLLTEHRDGIDHTKGLWTLLMLELFCQMFINGSPPPSDGRAPAFGQPVTH